MTFTQKYGSNWRLKGEKVRLKYGNNRKVYNNRSYHSILEAGYAQRLDLLLKAKEIKEVIPQFKIALNIGDYHLCNYYIDFKVVHNDDSIEFIEVKGFETDIWRLKWKILEALYSERSDVKLTIIK